MFSEKTALLQISDCIFSIKIVLAFLSVTGNRPIGGEFYFFVKMKSFFPMILKNCLHNPHFSPLLSQQKIVMMRLP